MIAKPNTREERVVLRGDDEYAVYVQKPPRNGEANIAVQKALANYFHTAPSNVRLVSDFSGRQKVFEILTALPK